VLTLTLVIPLRKVLGLAPGGGIAVKSMTMRIAQLLRGRTVGAGGPPIHPHLGLPQLKWLNLVVEEHPQGVDPG
jgi:hypothetical protein